MPAPESAHKIDRRSLLAAAATLVGGTAHAADALPALQACGSQSSVHVGVLAQNLATGAKLEWRADRRFVMCSTFKLALVDCVLARADIDGVLARHGRCRLATGSC